MTDDARARFDALLDAVLQTLPPDIIALLDESPLIVEDRPSPELLAEMDVGLEENLCGLHSGVALTERSVSEHPELPETIQMFREPVVDQAGGWECGSDAVTREIRITLLHEIGHHFGLDEDDLEGLGYA